MKLYNTLTRKIEDFRPLKDDHVSIYSCGPTVYDHIHIGNLRAFITADTLRRVLKTSGYNVRHVMNFTDVDDKTIRRSQERYPDVSPEEALHTLTREYETIFLGDMRAIGNEIDAVSFIRATDSIEHMRKLTTELYRQDFAYIADDGVYFSIEKYRASGKTYGQLLKLDTKNTSAARINNDEYDKENVHDFALWKTRKGAEPAWEFELDSHDLLGRPGWHIECSAMSTHNLGKPFDIHTGGVDLIFPHHENEIAQSTAGNGDIYAKFFVHNEHLLVDGKKMSKSLNNFYTLRDIQERGFDPLAFRLMILQSHYRSQTNFTWESLQAAQNRLDSLRAVAALRWQLKENGASPINWKESLHGIKEYLENDLGTPAALAKLSVIEDVQKLNNLGKAFEKPFLQFIHTLDEYLGLRLMEQGDITTAQKAIIKKRQKARDAKDWATSDQLRNQLKEQGVEIKDTPNGQIWSRTP